MNFSIFLVHFLLELFITNSSNLILDLLVNFTEILDAEFSRLVALFAGPALFVEFSTLAVNTKNVLLDALFFLIRNSVNLDLFLVNGC